MNIKPIETQYKGYRFRSRLEARWAVFFDTLGLNWEYEPEGYDLGPAGYYLPDFYLRDKGLFVEIKPTFESAKANADKFSAMANHKPILCLFDLPSEPPTKAQGLLWALDPGEAVDVYAIWWAHIDRPVFMAKDQLGSYLWDFPLYQFPLTEKGLPGRDLYLALCQTRPITNAFSAAVTARFEHGENGTRRP